MISNRAVSASAVRDTGAVKSWDFEADVVVVGLGAAGACVAIEAAEAGADVLVLERASGGGGTSAMSGGLIYLGGGTPVQQACGFEDSPEEMYKFLMAACGPEPDAAKVRIFCDESVAHFHWLVEHGVPFKHSFYPEPFMEAPTDDCLVYSGGEDAYPFDRIAKPAPRAHKPQAPGAAGGFFMQRLVSATERSGARLVSDACCETLVADKPQGPFTVLTRNRIVLGGHTYYARFFQSPSGLLVCHHSIARDGEVYFGQLKGTDFDAEGTLRLTWWPGNEVLKHKPVRIPAIATAGTGPVRMLSRKFDAATGFLLEGSIQLPDPLGAPCGLYIEYGSGVGTAILFNANGCAELGPVAGDGRGFNPDKTVDREKRFGETAGFRLLVKGSLLEIYLDDFLIECYSLPATATGRLGLIAGGRQNSIRVLKAWK